jgi:spoIIIJ-associated protein
MEWVEVTGRTVEEAKESALDQLGVAETDAEVIVVTEPKTGLFGRLREEARVRARVQPLGPRPKRTRRPRERSRGGDQERSSGQGRSNGGQRSGSRSSSERGPGGAGNGNRNRSGRGRGGGGRSSSGGAERAEGQGSRDQAPKPTRGATRNGSMSEEEKAMAEGMTLEEQGAIAKDFLQGLLDQFGFQGSVDTRVVDEETIEVAATGSDLGLLVGPRGSTLAAIQDVTRTVVQRHFPSKTDRILVDVAGYREKRAAALQRFSEQIAAEVIESGNERALEPMSPADRKVVHDSVNGIDGVATRSEGEDPHRYIVISRA